MKCNEFKQMIPDIIDKKIPDDRLAEVVAHVENCKECYDEMEIFYILQYGLRETDEIHKNMDLVGDLERCISGMKKRSIRYRRSAFMKTTTFVTAEAAILLALAYMTMNYFI